MDCGDGGGGNAILEGPVDHIIYGDYIVSLSSFKWDASEVTGYEEPFEVTSSKMTVNVLQDNAIEYAHFIFCFCFTICSEINSFQRPLQSPILRLKDGGLKT